MKLLGELLLLGDCGESRALDTCEGEPGLALDHLERGQDDISDPDKSPRS